MKKISKAPLSFLFPKRFVNLESPHNIVSNFVGKITWKGTENVLILYLKSLFHTSKFKKLLCELIMKLYIISNVEEYFSAYFVGTLLCVKLNCTKKLLFEKTPYVSSLVIQLLNTSQSYYAHICLR